MILLGKRSLANSMPVITEATVVIGKAFCYSHSRDQKQIFRRVKNIFFWSRCTSNLLDKLSLGNRHIAAVMFANTFIQRADLKNLGKPPL